ncbi:Bug family tripartite tricarboxylate transporter substrate binding protein [Achromobacter aloeverae]
MKKQLFAAILIACISSGAAAGDAYPSSPVTATVGYVPGGAADIIMRKLAQIMAPKFPHGLVVENKPGAGGSVAVSILMGSRPDGYRFTFLPQANLALSPQINKLSYKTPDDVLPVINTVSFSPVMLVPSNSPYKTLQDLLQAAKKSPGSISVGYPGVGTVSELNLVELEQTAGVKLINIPTQGFGQAAPLLMGNQITALIAQASEAVPVLKSGQMRALGSFSETRQSGLPDVPTMAEQGEPVHFGVRYLIVVPKGTPKNAVDYIHDAVKAALETPEFKKFSAENSLDITYQDGATALAAAKADYQQYTPILKKIGLVE